MVVPICSLLHLPLNTTIYSIPTTICGQGSPVVHSKGCAKYTHIYFQLFYNKKINIIIYKCNNRVVWNILYCAISHNRRSRPLYVVVTWMMDITSFPSLHFHDLLNSYLKMSLLLTDLYMWLFYFITQIFNIIFQLYNSCVCCSRIMQSKLYHVNWYVSCIRVRVMFEFQGCKLGSCWGWECP